MTAHGFQVVCYRGISPKASHLEIDVGLALPVAFGGLRRILGRLHEFAPEAVEFIAQRSKPEWNELFPGRFASASPLVTLANAPSERRLSRDSEQVFRVLQVAAQALLAAAAAINEPIVLRNVYACDLVSLRGLMRAVEWSRLFGWSVPLTLADWDYPHASSSCLVDDRLAAYRDQIRQRMDAPLHYSTPASTLLLSADEVTTAEARYLMLACDPQAAPVLRVAAALHAVRACFFSTNYAGALFACEQGLEQCTAASSAGPHALAEAFAALTENQSPIVAIEMDQARLNAQPEPAALLWQAVGVVNAFLGDPAAALEAFSHGLRAQPEPVSAARLHMYRALLLIKRYGNINATIDEVRCGLALVEDSSAPAALLEQGWLRNVLALAYYRCRNHAQAVAEIKRAIKQVAAADDDYLLHLKLNLISNISALQEGTQRYPEAIIMWQRLMKIGERWGGNFLKHYGYRAAGLHLLAGDIATATTLYTQVYQSTTETQDSYHQQAIAAELGQWHLAEGNAAEATRWFTRAVESGTAIGDPFRLGESLVGLTLAGDTTDFSAAAAVFRATRSYQPAAAQWLAALADDTPGDRLAALLPRPNTTLNRPFNLVNIDWLT